MRLLKLGVSGHDVVAWKIFLRGSDPTSTLVVDDAFDESTLEATKSFQKSVGFTGHDVDGIVGRMTYAKAMELGFDPNIVDDRLDEGPNWPCKPDGLKQLSYVECEEMFGKFTYVPAPTSHNPEGIKITDNWVHENITRVYVPQLVGVRGAPNSGKIFVNKKIADQCVSLFQAWDDAGLNDLILTWAGSWVPRFIRGSRTRLSNHAWGTAFDINAPWNGLGRQPALKGRKGSVRELVQIANVYGAFWGGHFRSRLDGMHFEFVRISQ